MTKNVCNDVTALSFGDIIPNPVGDIYNLFFHGKSIMDLFCHINKHLGHLRDVRDKRTDTFLFLHFPESMTFNDVKEILKEYENFLKFGGKDIICVYSVDLSRFMKQSKL